MALNIGFLLEAFLAFLCFLIFHFVLHKRTHESFLRNWPFLGMLPGLLVVLHRIYDYSVEVLENSNLTFSFEGPWFCGIDALITVDPANIHYIMSSNFSNYNKGSEFKEIFDVLGDGIFNSDSELWINLRKSAQEMLNHQTFQRYSLRTNINKLKKGVVPLLDHVAEKKMVVDLQDVFQRLAFDTTFILVTGYDPRSLSIEMPEVEFSKALDEVEEAIAYRHFKPAILWKLQNWIGFGIEKKMRRAHATLDRICAKYISAKREEISRGVPFHPNEEAEDLLMSYIKVDTTKYELLNSSDDKFLRDIILNFMIAGRDTTSSALTWFFWLLSKNPEALNKIRHEINTELPRTKSLEKLFDPKDMNKLVYLHGALREALRLYPPVPFERKSPIKPDVLPSGHRVDANARIAIFLYALGRMNAVWGEDASKFKPERWISRSGELKHEPSFKFLSFNAGPRTCLGKEVAFTQMKMVAVEIIESYDIEVIDGHRVEPLFSIILQMKHGLKVMITKRCSV